MNIKILGLLIAKGAPNEAQADDNVETLARLATTFGVILASAFQGSTIFLPVYGEIV
ncbi:hypothetical protein JCM18901_2345 [Psychrobacter sp. JCM 18901]|uniref:hypothetical protein n=1 Tax=unclassified Psychrobacter TaxID=196806 RepID=UPI000435311F|nr:MULTISPECIES: hypothetical protein [unclassified Psychrobacter]GAF53599.1 hypothetical protein JCM18900_12183 [Psychrobacter sp. JCM 18900]GAF56604.1 hypothetical protein JCM18901_2345 [Psychrobacter sp. JCM 18901]